MLRLWQFGRDRISQIVPFAIVIADPSCRYSLHILHFLLRHFQVPDSSVSNDFMNFEFDRVLNRFGGCLKACTNCTFSKALATRSFVEVAMFFLFYWFLMSEK